MYMKYGSNNFDKDLNILEKKYKNNIYNGWNELVSQALNDAKEKNAIMSMWNLTRLIAGILSKSSKQASTKWNLILSKDLGYSGFADKFGKGYIHEAEPMQAVFFRTSAFELLHRVPNIPKMK